MNYKRITIATLMGIVCGFICVGLASGGGPMPLVVTLSIITGRTLIGFVIGISNLKLKWQIHGPLMGLIVGLPTAFGAMMGGNPRFSEGMMFASTLVMGILYGILIEFVTSVLFKAKHRA